MIESKVKPAGDYTLKFIEAQILAMNERLNQIKTDLDNNEIDLDIVQTVILDYTVIETIEWDKDLDKQYDINLHD